VHIILVPQFFCGIFINKNKNCDMSNDNPLFHLGAFYFLYICAKMFWKGYTEDSNVLKPNITQDVLPLDETYQFKVELKAKKSGYAYYIDGNLMAVKHDIFYLRLLGIDWTKTTITEKVIYEAYYATILNLTVALDDLQIEPNELIRPELAKAACDYLIDRKTFLGFEN
jgi:hypothetical protein